ncbi:membrane protein YczE [Saccharomonospora xinjiangensis]|uniref:Putative membrane protein n=1 Tax=Saccharomonospora xinjiangensis XJ-54 TaxID=882086 RepID=I0V1N7_9PSEU|nr:membrane protein [Saccharomonospora xinjiangensis]EID54040.1 putative membrane protein [Saccharomonospora xinjiangensis XJ-54]
MKTSVELSPVPVTTAPALRLTQLFVGLVCFGTSMAMMTRSGLGLNPWDVLHEGVADRTALSFGTVTALTAVAVLALWIPLRQRPGVGTVANVAVIAVVVDLVRWVLPDAHHLAWQVGLLLGGIVLNGFATAVYVGARLGPGPRDGLMTGLSARTNWSVRLVRTAIEVVVLAVGWLLGGTVGVGTVLFALAIGPLTQLFLPYVTWSPKRA